MKSLTSVLFAILVLLFVTSTGLAQDPVKVDSSHYKVEFENDQVRAIRIHVGPHEKSPMHEHPESVVIFLTDGHGKFTFPDGKVEEVSWKAGEMAWFPAVKHQPENLSDQPLDIIQIEMKPQPKMTEKN